MSDNPETHPTLENVLPKWKLPSLFKARKPYGRFLEKGAIAAIPGGFPCPWCDASCIEEDKSSFAVCERNPLHKVQWCPWGG